MLSGGSKRAIHSVALDLAFALVFAPCGIMPLRQLAGAPSPAASASARVTLKIMAYWTSSQSLADVLSLTLAFSGRAVRPVSYGVPHDMTMRDTFNGRSLSISVDWPAWRVPTRAREAREGGGLWLRERGGPNVGS